MEIYWLLLACLAAFFVAWNNGSNNAANAIGTVVGAGAISLKKALIVTALFDFLGALLFGRFVSLTIMKGIVDISMIPNSDIVIKGMIATLIATGIWVLIATWFKIPMSISEGTVGGVIGFGLVAIGMEMINWNTVTIIVTSWIILPIFSGLMAIALYHVFERMFRKSDLLPYVAIISLFIMIFSTLFLLMVKTMKLSDLMYVTVLSVLVGLLGVGFFTLYYRIKIHKRTLMKEELIKSLLLVAATSMAFSHGANDVANAAGPLSAVIIALTHGYVPEVVDISLSALTFAAAGIAIGIVSWGYRVVETIGEKITTLTYSSAFTAQLSASLSVLIVTRLGLPVSTTIAIVGAVAGVGFAKGFKAVNRRVLFKIFSAWIIAFPVVIFMSALIFLALHFIS